MALSYTTLTALINEKYMPTLYDNFFAKVNYLVNRLKAKAKTYNDRKIVVPLEYADGSNAQATTKYQHINLSPTDPITAAEYEPHMITDSLIISLEEELVMNSDKAVKNILDAKMKNVQKGMQKYFTTRFWARSTDTTKEWNSLYTCNGSGTFGGIAVADFSGWQTHILNATSLGDNPELEQDLIDPSKACYILKLLQRGIALCKLQTGEDPDIISLPQYLWDLIEFIIDPRKTGSKMSEKAGELGFTALRYRNTDIVADNDMVVAQTGDTDGYIEFINTAYTYMFFNSGAKFKAQEFVRPGNANYKSCLINVYGNLVSSNRNASARITNVRSPKSYAGLS